ncbi:unnamed protein product [Mytilus coruscus]|uniref:Endonuclease/exonuclease/phosphatase domain-containing protein n=1 Tax=Mytilus coruscus TaxID=42192 RepID=A0A6J8CHU2_MYTCO|nr:unnamed protein product [Mytilus coruscus]
MQATENEQSGLDVAMRKGIVEENDEKNITDGLFNGHPDNNVESSDDEQLSSEEKVSDKQKTSSVSALKTRLKSDEAYRKKFLIFVTICYNFFVLGVNVGQFGPTVLDLKKITSCSLDQASFLFNANALGYLSSSVIVGFTFERFNKLLQMCFAAALLSVVVVIIPWCSVYEVMVTIHFFKGFFMGIEDAASSPKGNNSMNNNTPKSNTSKNRTNSSNVFNIPKKQNLRILTLNCRSIKDKTSEFSAAVNYIKPDIICGTEYWLKGEKPGKKLTKVAIKSSKVFPENYTTYRNDRGTLGGGVFILVQNDIIAIEKPEFVTKCEIEWVKIQLKDKKDLTIVSFYMPHRNMEDIKELDRSLDQISNKNPNIILIGDFICPDINWNTMFIHQNAKDKEIQRALMEVIISHSITQIHETPTRGNNLLDIVLTTNPSLIKTSTNAPGMSDHDVIVTDCDTKPHYQIGNALLLHLLASEVKTYMQILHFMFAFGGIIAPLISAPFLSKDDPVESQSYNRTTWNNTDNYVFSQNTTGSQNVSHINASEPFYIQSNLPIGTGSDSEVYKAYTISAVLTLLSALSFIVLYCRSDESTCPSLKSENEGHKEEKVNGRIRVLGLIILCMIIASYTAVEDTYAGFLVAFTVKYFDWTKARGAFATSVFWTSFAIGRFCGIFIVNLISQVKILFFYSLTIIAAFICLLVTSLYQLSEGVWIASAIVGFGMSIFFPIFFSWTEEKFFHVDGKIASLIMACACLGVIINPIILARVMDTTPIWFGYILTVESAVLLIFFALAVYIARLVKLERLNHCKESDMVIEVNECNSPSNEISSL